MNKLEFFVIHLLVLDPIGCSGGTSYHFALVRNASSQRGKWIRAARIHSSFA